MLVVDRCQENYDIHQFKSDNDSFHYLYYYQEFTVLGLDGVTPIPGVWQEFPAHGLPPPDCRETDFTRDNHLGNGQGGNPATYNWTIPVTLEHEQCAIRIRYHWTYIVLYGLLCLQ